jgi:Fe-S-cluster containining protein
MIKSDVLLGVKSAMMDAAQKSEKKRLLVLKDKAPCAPGCSSCCSKMVHITIAEALVIWTHLSNTGKIKKVLKKSEEMSSISRMSNAVSWFKMNLKCPILDESTNLCQAYEVRPPACSIHFVSSDPKSCDPWETRYEPYKSEALGDVYKEFRNKFEAEVDGHGIFAYVMPIPQALILADRISRTKWSDWSQMADFVLQELK